MQQVVVGFDGSPASVAALRWAADTAGRDGVRLLIACGRHDTSTAPRERDQLLREARLLARQWGSAFDTAVLACDDEPTELLVELSHSARLLVVGRHLCSAPGRPDFVTADQLDDITLPVAAHARCGVVVVPGSWQHDAGSRRPVALGLSPSPSGQAAARFAFRMAELHQRPVVAVRALTRLDRTPAADADDAQPDPLAERFDDLLDGMLRQCQLHHPGVEVHSARPSEPVSAALAEIAGRSDLLVVGARHTDEHAFSRLGPATADLLRTATCPVAIVGSGSENASETVYRQPATAGR